MQREHAAYLIRGDVLIHQTPDLIEAETKLLEGQNAVQVGKLAGAVIAVAVCGSMCRGDSNPIWS
jgi:hypothetical protein